MERRKYPIRAEDYELHEMVGKGASATVHRAVCIPLDEVVAIKILDFERNNSDLNTISREAKTMILIDHPNVLKAHCSFVHGHDLWVVMPYMAGGSCLHIMKSAFSNGFEEVIIASILREVLKGLEYLHQHGEIHRDIKAGNILVDSRGGIKLGDFGVSASLYDSGDRQRTRNTFVGTPCWMAPEVLEQLRGYDFKADIWSFGITALELAHGHAPFSKYPPMKVLLMTLQHAPPCLEEVKNKRFSRSFKHMIAMCLVKDPSKRPTAQKLLKQSFFKQARSSDYISRKILEGLPALGDRYEALRAKEEELLAQKKMPDEQKEELSQNEYKRGISSWNFDIEDLKAQASLISDSEDSLPSKYLDRSPSSMFELVSVQENMPDDNALFSRSGSISDDMESDVVMPNKLAAFPSPDQAGGYQRSISDGFDNESKASSCAGDQYPTRNSLQTCSNHGNSGSPGADEKFFECAPTHACHERRTSSGSCSPGIPPLSKVDSFKQQTQVQSICSGGGSHGVNDSPHEAIAKAVKPPGKVTSAEDLEDKSKVPVVQQKGRFKVTSESVDMDKALPPLSLPKSHSMQVISPLPTMCASSPSDLTSNIPSYSLFLQLNSILQANIQQRDNILGLMKQLCAGDSSANQSTEGSCLVSPGVVTEKLSLENEREKDLIQELTDLQLRYICLQEEVQKLKPRNAQI
ncbi:Non-specific serine/threonine protein kinase protein [Dioscorea alata]|uniref:Non-specific serine/threonine protein kinase protein n=1 Tax=Dioscorea alata TaxID=55571 RepID=A0ACB7WIW2_DIOAL|nr:Non-specific serine/threonine protein kinase protein [Dioscorea alata]